MCENDEFCVKNEGFCVKNEELCIKNEECCIQNDELCSATIYQWVLDLPAIPAFLVLMVTLVRGKIRTIPGFSVENSTKWWDLPLISLMFPLKFRNFWGKLAPPTCREISDWRNPEAAGEFSMEES